MDEDTYELEYEEEQLHSEGWEEIRLERAIQKEADERDNFKQK